MVLPVSVFTKTCIQHSLGGRSINSPWHHRSAFATACLIAAGTYRYSRVSHSTSSGAAVEQAADTSQSPWAVTRFRISVTRRISGHSRRRVAVPLALVLRLCSRTVSRPAAPATEPNAATFIKLAMARMGDAVA